MTNETVLEQGANSNSKKLLLDECKIKILHVISQQITPPNPVMLLDGFREKILEVAEVLSVPEITVKHDSAKSTIIISFSVELIDGSYFVHNETVALQ